MIWKRWQCHQKHKAWDWWHPGPVGDIIYSTKIKKYIIDNQLGIIKLIVIHNWLININWDMGYVWENILDGLDPLHRETGTLPNINGWV